ncbi:MAG TPA: hypothetical protein PK268_01385 [Enterococcus sp.]|nr:hypothetical protein [Enterococcus sp.]HPR80559.1 hypothetical protein [Enterococcus sp.]
MVNQLVSRIPFSTIPLSLYDLSQTVKTQTPDIWPTSNLRNIMARTPARYEARIGQETIVKYYSDSKRTKLVKTINKTYWVG